MDIKNIKKIAHLMLNLDLIPTQIDIFVQHPFTNCKLCGVKIDSSLQMLDLDKAEHLKKWRQYISSQIDQMTLSQIFMIMDTRYKLVFLQFIKDYLTKKELGKYLKSIWSTIEFNSSDPDVTVEEIIHLFEIADKKTLMDKNEYNIYNKFPSTVKVYRGVTDKNKDNKKAVSWTLDKDTAKWFSERFTKKGIVLEQEVSKDKILCYFKNEDEVIINTI